VRVLVHSLFGLLAAAALIVCAWICWDAAKLVHKPFIGLSIVEEGLVNPAGLTSWGAKDAGFHLWDRIVAVDGKAVHTKDELMRAALARPAPSPVVYQVVGVGGDVRFVELPTRIFQVGDLVKSHTNQAFLGLMLVIIAVLLYFLRPGTPEAWSFFLLFASIGTAMASVTDMTLIWHMPPLFPLLAPFLGSLGLVLVGTITRAYSRTEGRRALESAPEAGEPGFEDDEGRLPHGRMWALTGAAFAVSTVISAGLFTTRGDIKRYVVFDAALYTWIGICILIGLGLLSLAYVRGRSPRRRARIRQILWAWPVGAGIPVLNLFVGQVLHLSQFSLIWNGFLLLVPISTADAIVRHDLLRLNTAARRLVGGLTVAAIVGIGLGVVLWVSVQFLALDEPAAMVALAALLFAVAAPLTHRVQSHVESLLHQKRYDGGRLLAAFTARASTAMHMPDAIAQLRSTLDQSIQPQHFTLYRLDREARVLVPQDGVGASVPVDERIAPWLERADPWVIDDEQPAPASLKGAALAVRLAVANEPVGFLVIGHRPEGTPYEAADVSFVVSLAGPLAAALVNALAFDAVERLNRELEGRVADRTKQLAQKNDELKVLNERKDELVATVSHDFRTPLAIIRQNVQTILRDLGQMDGEDLRALLGAISRQETRLAALCTNLLDLQRLKQLAPQESVLMDDIARKIVDDLLPRATERGLDLTVVAETGAPVMVRGDSTRLAQVLQNLVDNAIKFTPRGGHIGVRLARHHDARLLIEVKDDGCGVPADAIPRLFEPFFQVPRQQTSGEGSGLGLAIVKAVVDAHRGTIAVASEDGKGTTFSLLFPAEVPVRDDAAPARTAAE
jgi:signal transduction histidine kinase